MKHTSMRRWIYLACLLIVHGVFSCEENESQMNENKKMLVDVGIWKITKLKVGSDEVPLDACFLDNEFHFEANNEYTMNEGATKCDPADPQTMTGEWSLTSNGSGLVITVDGTTKITAIDELSGTSLKIHYDLGPLRYEETYAPK